MFLLFFKKKEAVIKKISSFSCLPFGWIDEEKCHPHIFHSSSPLNLLRSLRQKKKGLKCVHRERCKHTVRTEKKKFFVFLVLKIFMPCSEIKSFSPSVNSFPLLVIYYSIFTPSSSLFVLPTSAIVLYELTQGRRKRYILHPTTPLFAYQLGVLLI